MSKGENDSTICATCPRDLRERFIGTCKANDTNISRVFREFMREFIKSKGKVKYEQR
jgi:hypothetical protein